MGKMTFVVEFEDGKEPPFQFTDDFMGMGGKLCSVAAFDYKDDLLLKTRFQPFKGYLVSMKGILSHGAMSIRWNLKRSNENLI